MQGDPLYAPVIRLWDSQKPKPYLRPQAEADLQWLCMKFYYFPKGRRPRMRRLWLDPDVRAVGDYVLMYGRARLCHDLSHLVYKHRTGINGHGVVHAALELKMAKSVIGITDL